MYLYFNKEGILTTIIPHGEPIRQGSYLNIYVCLDEDFFEDEYSRNNSTINIDLILPNGKMGTTKMVPINNPIEPEQFTKTKDSEITYDLVPNRLYWTYHFRWTPEQSTIYAGKLIANISILKYVNSINEDIQYFGNADLYVEKTFGTSKRVIDEASLHYKNLLDQINLLNINKAEQKALDKVIDDLNNLRENVILDIGTINSLNDLGQFTERNIYGFTISSNGFSTSGILFNHIDPTLTTRQLQTAFIVGSYQIETLNATYTSARRYNTGMGWSAWEYSPLATKADIEILHSITLGYEEVE
ncbi:hypothetical protein [Mammaliicoccus vitulinus]|uniref:hypothetical protein n=1 Tax=Mammaliicoccus vitulinus TaxID=71237 RepID=UPI00248BE6D4|nr:hypothetical protein [Mammaliicoccus vitulinus]